MLRFIARLRRSRLGYTSLVLAVLLAGCKRPARLQFRNTAELMPLNGQVFVVTRGAENIRLGHLSVYLVSLTQFRDLHLNDVVESKIRDLRQQFVIAKGRGDEREALVREIKSNYAVLVDERDQLLTLLPAAAILHDKYNAVLSEIEKRDRQLGQYAANLQRAGKSSYSGCELIASAATDLLDITADFAYERLLPVSESCTTDADGRFHFQYPVEQEIVIFTRGHRELPSGKTEKYRWFVSARTGRDTQRQVLLTNDNLISGPAAENLFSELRGPASQIDFDIPESEDRTLATPAPLPQEPRWAKPHVFYLLSYMSVSTQTGVIGLSPGTELYEHQRTSTRLVGKCAGLQVDVEFTSVTDNVDLATQVRNADHDMQSNIAAWQKKQSEADQANRDEQNRQYDEAQRRIDKAYKRMHSLTGESRLNEPAHR
jgi:hypothetical protein